MSARLDNWGLRVLALVIALALWFVLSVDRRERLSQKTFEVTVAYDAPENLVILEPVNAVSVRVRGAASQVRDLTPAMIDVIVQVPEGQVGTIDMPLGVSAPDGVEVLSIDPNIIALRTEAKMTRRIPVDPQLIGEPAAGAVVTSARALDNDRQPARVLVSGPESRVLQVRALTTLPVDLTSHALSFEERARVVSPDALVRPLEPTVVVQVQLAVPGIDTEQQGINPVQQGVVP